MLVLFLLLSLAAGAIGRAVVPPTFATWYPSLNKPSWTPGAQVFAVVWTSLFVLMGVSAWLVWRAAGMYRAEVPLLLFCIQLAFNAAWTWIFFGLHRLGLALLENIALWILVIITTVSFWRIRRSAGVLMLPYVGWLVFAIVLNGTIWWMN